jgi:hypothetical protein
VPEGGGAGQQRLRAEIRRLGQYRSAISRTH